MSEAVQSVSTPAVNNGSIANGELELERILRDVADDRVAAVQELRNFISPGLHWLLKRKLANRDVDHIANGILERVLSAVQLGHLQTGAEVQSFLRSAALTAARQTSGFKKATIDLSQTGAMLQALNEFTDPEKEAIARYLRGEDIQKICAVTELAPEEVTALLSTLKRRFHELDCRTAPQSRFFGWLRTHIA